MKIPSPVPGSRPSTPAASPLASLQAPPAQAAPAATGFPAAAGSWSPAYTAYEQVADKVESVEGWLLQGQEKMLFDIARSLPDHAVILEMGAYLGRSTCALAFACVGSGKRIYSIDSFCGNDGMMGKTDSDNYDRWYGNLQRFGLEKYATPLRGWTNEVLKDWHKFPKVDFVFIDASHEYLDVLRDFEMIYPYVKEGGWIAFHDVEPSWPGPWRVWVNCARPILVEHRYSSTLAAGRKPAGAPPIPKGFFRFSERWPEAIEATYPNLGPLAEAMRTSVAGRRASPAERQALLRAEMAIGGMPKELRDALHFMVLKDGAMDGTLHLWHGMNLLAQARCAEALAAFERAMRVSFPVTRERVDEYRKVAENMLRDPSACAVPPPPPDGKDKHYRLKDVREYDWWDHRRRLRREVNLPWFQGHVSPGDHVIELDCGEGLLVSGLACRAKIGIERDFQARKVAALNFGIDTFDDPAAIPPSWAQVILANHALEASPAPLETLKSLLPLLEKGGKLVFSVTWGRPRQHYIPGAPDAGLYRWDAQALGNLFQAAGCKIVEIESGTLELPPECREPLDGTPDQADPEECIVRIVAVKP